MLTIVGGLPPFDRLPNGAARRSTCTVFVLDHKLPSSSTNHHCGRFPGLVDAIVTYTLEDVPVPLQDAASEHWKDSTYLKKRFKKYTGTMNYLGERNYSANPYIVRISIARISTVHPPRMQQFTRQARIYQLVPPSNKAGTKGFRGFIERILRTPYKIGGTHPTSQPQAGDSKFRLPPSMTIWMTKRTVSARAPLLILSQPVTEDGKRRRVDEKPSRNGQVLDRVTQRTIGNVEDYFATLLDRTSTENIYNPDICIGRCRFGNPDTRTEVWPTVQDRDNCTGPRL